MTWRLDFYEESQRGVLEEEMIDARRLLQTQGFEVAKHCYFLGSISSSKYIVSVGRMKF